MFVDDENDTGNGLFWWFLCHLLSTDDTACLKETPLVSSMFGTTSNHQFRVQFAKKVIHESGKHFTLALFFCVVFIPQNGTVLIIFNIGQCNFIYIYLETFIMQHVIIKHIIIFHMETCVHCASTLTFLEKCTLSHHYDRYLCKYRILNWKWLTNTHRFPYGS